MRCIGGVIVLFQSIHDVMAVDRELEQSEIAHELVPVPKELSSDCGMAIEVGDGDLEPLLDRLDSSNARWTDVYRRGMGGFERILRADEPRAER